MAATRQWRLMVNGEVIDLEDRSEGAPARVAPTRARQVSGLMTRTQRENWRILGAGAAFEVLLSVAALALLGPGWEMLLLGSFALALLFVGAAVNR